MKRLLPILAILCMVGCKTTQPITQTKDSVRIEYRLDSIYVYEKDSLYIDRYTKGDTIYVTKEAWKTRWKDKVVEVHDTISVVQQETIVQEVERPKSGWDKFSTWFTIISLILIVLYIVWRIVKAVYLRK